MFKNLLRLHHPFYDFNSTEFFDRIEKVTGKEIGGILYTAITDPEADALEPANVEIFATTLSPSSCKAYFRTYPDLSAVDRDYYLSKLFQFIHPAMSDARLDYEWEALESELDRIPQSALETAHRTFDVRGLQQVLARNPAPSIKTILTACNLLSKRPMTPGRTGRTKPNKRLASKRCKLLRQFQDAEGSTKLLCGRLGGMDRSQVSRWKRGMLPDSSEVTKRIETGILNFISEQTRVGGK